MVGIVNPEVIKKTFSDKEIENICNSDNVLSIYPKRFLRINKKIGSKIKHRIRKKIRFFLNRRDCVFCGAKGKYFAIHGNGKRVKFNFLAKKNEQLVVMTIDHIIPLSKGGKNVLENMQPMCYNCNQKKADKMPSFLEVENFPR